MRPDKDHSPSLREPLHFKRRRTDSTSSRGAGGGMLKACGLQGVAAAARALGVALSQKVPGPGAPLMDSATAPTAPGCGSKPDTLSPVDAPPDGNETPRLKDVRGTQRADGYAYFFNQDSFTKAGSGRAAHDALSLPGLKAEASRAIW